MPNDWHPTNGRDDREQVTKAREAAEVLFKPKQRVNGTESPTSAPIAPLQVEPQVPRKPRIIAIPSVMPVAEEVVEIPADPKPKSRRETTRRAKIPASQYGRVRALALYGMTFGEVAELYGVPVKVIERIVGAGTGDNSSTNE